MNATQYANWIRSAYIQGEENAFEAYKLTFGAAVPMEKGEQDYQWVTRCAEIDYTNGASGEAVFQHIYDRLRAIDEESKGWPALPETECEKDQYGILLIGVCDVFRAIYGVGKDKSLYDDKVYCADAWEGQCAKLMRYCEMHNLHYYGAPGEDFFLWRGAEEARNLGKKGVVLDNLS